MLTIQTKIKMQIKKNINLGKINFIIFIFFFFLLSSYSISKEKNSLEGKFVEIKVLDKVSSKNNTIVLELKKQIKFKNLEIKAMKCKNSKFDDNPEVTAYLQVKDLSEKDNDKVFVFNGWTFSSSPSLKPFDHPVYDIWLIKCFN